MMHLLKNKTFIEWAVILVVVGTLYITGLHTEVIGRLQQAILYTGVIKPDTEEAGEVNGTEIADYNWQLGTADGETVDMNDMKGKVLFINLWATWCPPCIAEMPGINNLYEDMAGGDVQYIMLSMDEDFEKAKQFVKKKDFSFPVFNMQSAMPEVFRSRTLPTTFVVAKDGKVVVRHQGMADYDNSEMRDLLERLSDQ